ncbi:hypothetical protein [Planobispora longispora]|uniref:Uncharacterized protein n=1 Tax=Planobispora longispora TaxID=28887 RepID=A0A8J3RNP3_9ACTN|nr:hypothetical protein [Planobispora longispora]BFE84230.1 hypothetical protein GCM10020093_068310 [Planobispora longispora]GIH79012.1 hypothetical protein Plo01_54410 [Planobispora longispora]
MNGLVQASQPGDGAVSAVDAAKCLRSELSRLDITADVNDGYGLAVVSVWAGLVVWSDGRRFWWRTGGWDIRRGRAVYAWHTAMEPGRAARRIAFRYAELARAHPLPAALTEAHGASPR